MSRYTENLSNMTCLDLYLESRNEKEYKDLQKNILPLESSLSLLGMDFYVENHMENLKKGRKKSDLKNLIRFGKQYDWEFKEEWLSTWDYDALVITNPGQTIQWVNKGFTEMTGFPMGYAMGKTPRFLQGEKTCTIKKKNIREKLKNNNIFTETVINYRKNKEIYKCEITILPILNSNKKLSHFLAIEKEVA